MRQKGKSFAKLLWGILVFSIFLSIGFSHAAREAFAAGSSKTNAEKLEIGDTLTGTVAKDAPQHWYIFQTEKDSDYWYQFQYLNLDGTGAIVTLYDEDFQELGKMQDGGRNEMSYKLDASATYYLCISETPIYSRTETSEFKVKTQKALDDGADTMGKAKQELISGKKYEFALQNREDEDYFYFIAGAEKTKLSLGTSIVNGVKFFVYDENKKSLAYIYAAQDETKIQTIETIKGQKYYICVKQEFPTLFSSKEYAGDFTVLVDSGSKPDTEITFAVTLKKGSTLQLNALLQPSGTKAQKAVWKSSKKTVAKVDSKGKITAVKKGTAIITVTVGDLTQTIQISVTN